MALKANLARIDDLLAIDMMALTLIKNMLFGEYRA